jgi:coproporphyrinogen III oxidase-like Fe-S oxidoreductase
VEGQREAQGWFPFNDEDVIERLAFQLRLAEGLCMDDVSPAWKTRFTQFEQQEIMKLSSSRWQLTTRGREVCDALIRELMG